jgi:beta-phosphoglucomutase
MVANPMSEQTRAVLWDVDGTLVDSAEYHWLTWREALGREGFALTEELFASSFGQRNDAVLRGFLGAELSDAEVARIAGAKEESYRRVVRGRGLRPLPGVLAWLRRLRDEGWRQAVASSAPRENLDVILGAAGVAEFMDAVVSAEEIEHGKPHPEIFLRAAAAVGAEPSRCVVVEDAPAGVESGRRAGMRVVGVLTTQPRLDADIVVRSLEELPADAFEQLLAGTNVARGAEAGESR